MKSHDKSNATELKPKNHVKPSPVKPLPEKPVSLVAFFVPLLFFYHVDQAFIKCAYQVNKLSVSGFQVNNERSMTGNKLSVKNMGF